MRNDLLYWDPEYSWDGYIQARRLGNLRRVGEVCLNCAQNGLHDGKNDQQ